MEPRERFAVRGAPGLVTSKYFPDDFGTRRVDFWAPDKNSTHLLIAHDGQNVFDRKTATRGRTWRMAQTATKIFKKARLPLPIIIAVFNYSDLPDKNGRGKDLTPQQLFQNGISPVLSEIEPSRRLELGELRADKYHRDIVEHYIPTILAETKLSPTKRAMIGSSMGGLATLYGLSLYPSFYQTALALSCHWTIGGEPLVKALINSLPNPGNHQIWMSRGTKSLDKKYQPFQNLADELMANKGWQFGDTFKSKVYKRTSHNENAWASYLDDVFRFWLGV
jgi:predicted alpha/beta superfamily hydrolase